MLGHTSIIFISIMDTFYFQSRPITSVTGFIISITVHHIFPHLYYQSSYFRYISGIYIHIVYFNGIHLCMLWRFPLFPLRLLHQFSFTNLNCLWNVYLHVYPRNFLRNVPISWFKLFGCFLNIINFVKEMIDLPDFIKVETTNTHTVWRYNTPLRAKRKENGQVFHHICQALWMLSGPQWNHL